MVSLTIFGCQKKSEEVSFESEEGDVFFETVEEKKVEEINITASQKINQEFEVEFKTYQPDGVGQASFKAKSIKVIDKIGQVTANPEMKLVALELAVRGNSANKGRPSTFNQIGEFPSPQFVIIDKQAKTYLVEDTYFSQAYNEANKQFELSKITTDHQVWVNTAIVFEIGKDKQPDVAFMFTDTTGNKQFYEISTQ